MEDVDEVDIEMDSLEPGSEGSSGGGEELREVALNPAQGEGDDDPDLEATTVE